MLAVDFGHGFGPDEGMIDVELGYALCLKIAGIMEDSSSRIILNGSSDSEQLEALVVDLAIVSKQIALLIGAAAVLVDVQE